jgi:hypothetical protein
MKQNILIALGVVIASSIIFACGSVLSKQQIFGNAISGSSQVFFYVASSTAETVTTSNTTVLATSTGRTWARIANNSANAISCIYKNGAPATVGTGFIIAASSTFEMNQLAEPVYTGAVNCISNNAASATIYVEVNQ